MLIVRYNDRSNRSVDLAKKYVNRVIGDIEAEFKNQTDQLKAVMTDVSQEKAHAIATVNSLKKQIAEFEEITKNFSTRIEAVDESKESVALSSVYPNPGKDVFNIRTALPNAYVEVYDSNGKLIHHQEITNETTSIIAEKWASGSYVWKVISNGQEAENGKWIKQ